MSRETPRLRMGATQSQTLFGLLSSPLPSGPSPVPSLPAPSRLAPGFHPPTLLLPYPATPTRPSPRSSRPGPPSSPPVVDPSGSETQ